MENLNQLVLEETTNTHLVSSKKPIQNVKRFEAGDVYYELTHEGEVVHGEHRSHTLEQGKHICLRQNEYNPVTKAWTSVVD